MTPYHKAMAMQNGDALGWLASALVFLAFLARDMFPLRILATLSNFAFIAYGGLHHLWPIVVLHSAMLPVNLFRLAQLRWVQWLKKIP